MRSLTDGEAVAIRSLLAARPITERERIEETKLAPRTFEKIRRRAYSSGWVFDRLVPDPSRSGSRCVCFVIAQPFAEDIEPLQKKWADDPTNVLLWRWPETMLGVFFSHASPDSLPAELGLPKGRGESFVVTSDVLMPSVPVYFDFEAAWAQWTGLRGSLGYPHSLPTAGEPGAQSDDVGLREHQNLAILVRRPFQSGIVGAPLHVSPFFFPRSQQKLLRRGIIERRTFLDPREIPQYQGRSIERFALLEGELIVPGTEEKLFQLLMAIRVTPFLFASDGSRVLMAALSPAPPAVREAEVRPPVLRNLQVYLRSIKIVRESVRSLTVVTNHRYDRLFHTQP